jgi:hypothetical protein
MDTTKGLKMRIGANRQRGIGFVGFIMIAAGIIFVAVLGMKVIPPYIHSAQISKIFSDIANDPAMRSASVKEVRESFNKRANINYITDITADDIEIEKNEGDLSLSTNYSVKIPLVANITLLLEFNPSSD